MNFEKMELQQMVSPFLRRHWPYLALFVAVAAYYPRFKHPGGMQLYRHAAECVWMQQVLQVCDVAFTYPPAFAFFMLPFVPMPIWLAVFIWYLVTLTCTWWALILCKRLALRQFDESALDGKQLMWFQGISFLLSLKLILAVYEDQAFDLLVLPLALWGILALTERRNLAGGAALAVAAALKVTPLIFLPYLIFKRRFAAAALFVVVLITCSFCVDAFFTPNGGEHGYFLTWIKEVAAPGVFENPSGAKLAFWHDVNPYNLSLRGMIALALDKTSYQGSFQLILRIAQIVFVLVIAGLLLCARGWKMIAIECSLLIIAMLMLSPMSGRGHFVQLMLPYAVLVAAAIKDRSTAWLGVTVLAVSFVLCTTIPRDIVPRAYNEFMRTHSDITWGTLVLIIYFATIIWHPQNWSLKRKPIREESRGQGVA